MTKLGPDAVRYLHAGNGTPVARPFHLRWLLPSFCGTNLTAWTVVWWSSWPIAATGMFVWRWRTGDTWQIALAATVLLLALPGILGPQVCRPVSVDLPATALTLVGCALFEPNQPARIAAALIVWWAAAAIRETQPVWAALWLWSPWPLLALLAPLIRAMLVKPGPDPLGDRFQQIADHPFRASLEHHSGRWRDGWLMVAPWGVCLIALWQPSWSLIVLLTVAYLQLLVATDTVRLIHHAAGPVMAAAAAGHIPTSLLLVACVAQVVWWRTPERV